MNPQKIFTIWSYKKELRLVLTAFAIIIATPIVAVFILVNAGIDVVSDHLATVNPQTQQTQILNPATGQVVTTITNQVEWPMHGVVTLEFGANDLPYQPFHTGIDIADPNGQEGDPITPFMDGTVIAAEQLWWGYGKYVEVDNGNNVVSIYGHMSKIFVYPGEQVHLGQIIGLEGQTGWATGPHVHFEIRVYGIPVNPRTFVPGSP